MLNSQVNQVAQAVAGWRRGGNAGAGLIGFVSLVFLGWGCSPADKTAHSTAHGTHRHGAASQPAAEHDGCGGHAHAAPNIPANGGAKEEPGSEQDTHDHTGGAGCAAPTANLSPEAIEAKTCEHDIRTMDCGECRYEVGVVRLRKDVAEALVRTATVKENELVRTLRLTGEMALDATAVVEVVPMAPGRVVEVKVRLGQQVHAGETLAVIHSSEFGEAKATYLELLTAAEIAGRERDRQRLVNAALARLLGPLPKGQATLKIHGEPLGEWKSRLVSAAARLDHARSVFDREEGLMAKNASSQAELEAARREVQSAEADYVALVEEAQLGLELELLRAENAARQAEAKLAAARHRLHLFGLDDSAISERTDMPANGRFARMEVPAPRAGTILALTMTAGRSVDSAQSLCTIADLANLWVWCDLHERDLARLHEAMAGQATPAATVSVSAFPETFQGVIDLLGNEVNEATRTVKVRVQLRNPQGKLRPGMFAAVNVELPTGRKVALAPRSAILTDEGRPFVFQQWQDDLWLQRHVVLGESAGDQVEIASGVAPGALVVVSGGFMLKSDVLRAKMGAGCAD